jgi:tripartite ATP-independent transporter DctM subunit
VALAISGVLGIIAIIGFDPAMTLLATTFFSYGTSYAFIVIPLFVAMGLLAAESEISKDSYDTLAKWFGPIRGGLGLATVGACTIFGTLTGSSIVTSVVFARISGPEMIRHGYDPKITNGLVAAAGSIGMLIPPSVLVVFYALLTEESVGQLLMGGVGAGLVLAFCVGGAFVILVTLRSPSKTPAREIKTTWKERFASLPKLWPALTVAAVVIGGIYGGIFTVVEAAGMGTFILFLLFVITKRFSRGTWLALAACLRESLSLTVMVLFILVSAQVFGRLLVLSGLGRIMTDLLVHANLTVVQFLIGVTVLYIMLGCLIDGWSILAITVPVLMPVVRSMGIDPIWFGILLVVGTQIGTITPPVGLTVYAVKGVAGPEVSLEDIFRGVTPFFVALLVAQAILIAFPSIVTWIPYSIWK